MLNFFSESVTITVAYMPGSTASGQFVKATLASRATAIILPLTKQFNQQLQEELNLPLLLGNSTETTSATRWRTTTAATTATARSTSTITKTWRSHTHAFEFILTRSQLIDSERLKERENKRPQKHSIKTRPDRYRKTSA